jgi:hypothetical protein
MVFAKSLDKSTRCRCEAVFPGTDRQDDVPKQSPLKRVKLLKLEIAHLHWRAAQVSSRRTLLAKIFSDFAKAMIAVCFQLTRFWYHVFYNTIFQFKS